VSNSARLDARCPHIALQRYLRSERQFSFRVRKIGTVIPCLNPFNHSKEFLDTKNPQGQQDLQQEPKLRQRNGWCFFSPT
jgi:hypothetical protein